MRVARLLGVNPTEIFTTGATECNKITIKSGMHFYRDCAGDSSSNLVCTSRRRALTSPTTHPPRWPHRRRLAHRCHTYPHSAR
jgi:hypothetical protein